MQLIIFAAVNFSNFRLYQITKSKRWISFVGGIGCLVALGILMFESGITYPENLWILAIMFTLSFSIEIIYRKITGRKLKRNLDRN